MRGRTGICIFEGNYSGIRHIEVQQSCIYTGIMDAPVYVDILRQNLLPFIVSLYPDGHRFMQNNDSKHTSKLGESFLSSNYVNWWKKPPESPNWNPIENLWHELKEHLRREGIRMSSLMVLFSFGIQCLVRSAGST